MASLRTALGRGVASENEVPSNRIVGKSTLAGVGGLKSRPVRGAMQEIGNNAAVVAAAADKGFLFYIWILEFFMEVKAALQF